MFESVLTNEKRARRFIGGGALISIIAHAIVGGGVWALSSDEPKHKPKEKLLEVTLVQPTAPLPLAVEVAPPPPPPPPPPPAATVTPVVEARVETPKPKVEKPKPKTPAKPDTMVKAPPNKPEPTPDPSQAKPSDAGGSLAQTGGQVGGVEGGVAGGVVGGTVGGTIGGKIGGTGTGETVVIPFGEGMTRPKRLSGDEPRFSREALEANVSGMMIVKCVIEVDGRLENCRVVKALPYMEKAVLDALGTHRYSPVMFQGRPQRVDYTFTIKLIAPQ